MADYWTEMRGRLGEIERQRAEVARKQIAFKERALMRAANRSRKGFKEALLAYGF